MCMCMRGAGKSTQLRIEGTYEKEPRQKGNDINPITERERETEAGRTQARGRHQVIYSYPGGFPRIPLPTKTQTHTGTGPIGG